MNYKEHLTFATTVSLTTAISVAASGNDINIPIFTLSAMFGAFIVDIDSVNSKAGRTFHFVSKQIEKHDGHRTWCHYLITPMILSAILFFITMPEITFGFLFGYISHLFLDLFNNKPFAILFPFCKKKVSLAKIKCNSFSAKLVTVAFSILFSTIIIMTNYSNILNYITIKK